jgi:hypothetical protein
MKTFLLRLPWVLSAVLVSSTVLSRERHALVIGNQAYAGEDALAAPISDARLMASAFGRLGYEVSLAIDRRYVDMAADIEAFVEASGDAEIRVIYYAGHGFEFDSENYLLPVDAPGPFDTISRDKVRSAGLPLNRVLRDVESPGVSVVAIIDACRTAPSRGAGRPRALASQAAPEGTLLAFSTSPGKVAKDSMRAFGEPSDNSPYALHLAEQLDSQRHERWDQALNATQAVVRLATKGEQRPWSNFSGTEVPRIAAARLVKSDTGLSATTLPAPLSPRAIVSLPRPDAGRALSTERWRKEQLRILQMVAGIGTNGIADLEARSKAGDLGATVALASAFDAASGVARDVGRARRLFLYAAKEGHAIAQLDLGTSLYATKRTDTEGRGAEHWWQRAAAAGVGEAAAKLAMLRAQRGEIVPMQDFLNGFSEFLHAEKTSHDEYVNDILEASNRRATEDNREPNP